MSFKTVVGYWKEVIGLIIVVAGGVAGAYAWAEDQKALIRAEQSLIHNEMYQESRIARKEDQVNEHQRELDNLLEWIGDDEPTLRQAREIEYLDREIARLREEIEEIRVALNAENTE